MITKKQCDDAGIKYLTQYDQEQMYNDMLCEVYGTINICGYEYEAARALAEVDATAYRCGFSDYVSSLLDDEYIEIEDGCLITKEDAERIKNHEQE